MHLIAVNASILIILVCLSIPHTNSQNVSLGKRPVIGILSQEYKGGPNSYIAASYVKFIESAGARVIPIFINRNQEYYEQVFNGTNGLVFPGGGQDLLNSGYAKAAQVLWNLTMESNAINKPYPILGICLGFELLTVLAANNKNYLTSCDAEDIATNLDFDTHTTIDPRKSAIFGNADKKIIDIFRTENVTVNYHRKCMTPENFNKSELNNSFNIVSTNKDRNGSDFISMIEHNNPKYPIYGTQFHPEKNIFEFVLRKAQLNTPHSENAIIASQYIANFFVGKTRNSCHASDKLENQHNFIYNYNPIYTGRNPNATFEQIYVFSSSQSNLWLSNDIH